VPKSVGRMFDRLQRAIVERLAPFIASRLARASPSECFRRNGWSTAGQRSGQRPEPVSRERDASSVALSSLPVRERAVAARSPGGPMTTLPGTITASHVWTIEAVRNLGTTTDVEAARSTGRQRQPGQTRQRLTPDSRRHLTSPTPPMNHHHHHHHHHARTPSGPAARPTWRAHGNHHSRPAPTVSMWTTPGRPPAIWWCTG